MIVLQYAYVLQETSNYVDEKQDAFVSTIVIVFI